MKGFRIALIAVVFFGLVLTTQAQARLVTKGTSISPSTQPPVAASTLATIDSGAFTDATTGISRVTNAIKQVNTKFEPVNNELKGMQDRLATMRSDIQKKQSTQGPDLTRQQTDQADQLEVQLKRKAEDAQNDYQKQLNGALDPVQSEIFTALNAYAQSHGILLIIDVSRVPVIYSDNSIDITKDFIAEYNKTHPVGAPATPARP